MKLETIFYRAFLRFSLWHDRTLLLIGTSTGMNHRYLSTIRHDIRNNQAALTLLEMNNV